MPRSMKGSKVEKIARDFAEIPFEDHQARVLALAYIDTRLALENLIATLGTIEAGANPLSRLETALAEAREALAL